MRLLAGVTILCAILCRGVMAEEAKPPESPEPVRKGLRFGASIYFLPTPPEIVREMLWLADVGPEDVVYDLGSGDGRIVIAAVRDFGAKHSVGVELDPALIQQSRENAEHSHVSDRATFREEDLFTSDFSDATVVTLFIGHGPNVSLRARLFDLLPPGARIVSSQAGMGEWQPNKELTTFQTRVGMWGTMAAPFPGITDVPSYSENAWGMNMRSKTFLWVVPAPVAGVWVTEIETSAGRHELRLHLTQRLSDVTGTFEVLGEAPQSGWAQFDIWGDRVRWQCLPKSVAYGAFLVDFEGRARGNTMEGRVKVVEGRRPESGYRWEEERSLTREATDLEGTWSFVHPDDQRPLELTVERGDGGTKANLLDRDQRIELRDFYEFGGGFYFTYLYGDKGWGIDINEDTGWLIGKAHIAGDTLSGEVQFYVSTLLGTAKKGEDARNPKIEAWSAERLRR